MLPRNRKLNQRAKTFRKNMTPHERHLWFDFLRNYPIKIYRQRIIGNYIADFYCSKAKFIIEVDGSQHYEKDNREYDGPRTKYFNSLEIKVIRISNKDCDNNFDGVCLSIDREINNRCNL